MQYPFNEKLKKINTLNSSGQVLIEYAVMLLICAFIAIALMTLFGVFGEYGDTLIKFISVDYP
ncbi:MAG: hypothetical protein IKD09_03525 [Lentisphaeria bacterium]|nr:hypothetical protein [Lentisphaeria bacterium]